jgi:hypothetical protein
MSLLEKGEVCKLNRGMGSAMVGCHCGVNKSKFNQEKLKPD